MKETKTRKHNLATRLMTLLLAVTVFTGSFAYFTDQVTSSAEVVIGNMDIVFNDISAGMTGTNGIVSPNEFAVDEIWNKKVLVSEGQIINPGDFFDISYKLSNEGNKSADIRQRITLTSAVPMTADQGYSLNMPYTLADADVDAAATVEHNSVTYYKVAEAPVLAPAGYMKSGGYTYYPLSDNGSGVYTDASVYIDETGVYMVAPATISLDFAGILSADGLTKTYDFPGYTLNGTGIAAEVEEGITVSEMSQIMGLSFMAFSDNDYQGKGLSVTLDLQAKQHRNTQDNVWSDWESYEVNFEQVEKNVYGVYVPDGTKVGTSTDYLIQRGESIQLSAIPENGTWFTDNESVLSVTDAGLITGNEVGIATITYKVGQEVFAATFEVEFKDNDDEKANAYALLLNNSGDMNNAVPMIFVREDHAPLVGEVYESETYGALPITAVYTGFETEAYTGTNYIPWKNQQISITSVVVEDKVAPISTAYWFYSLYRCTTMDLTKLDTSKVTNMQQMFNNVGYTANSVMLNLSGWNTSNVTNMHKMFLDAGRIYTASFILVGLESWDTSNVTDMYSMFDKAGMNATTWDVGDLSKWNTSNVTNMYCMFWGAGESANYTLDLSGWDVSKVTLYSGFNTSVTDKVMMPAFNISA